MSQPGLPPPHPYGPPGYGPPAVRRPPSYELQQDAAAAWAARLELGPEFEEHIAAGLAERVEALAERRTAELSREASLAEREHADEQSGRVRQFALGIVTVVIGVPITAIAAVQTDPGLVGVAISWAGLVGINALHVLGLRRRR